MCLPKFLLDNPCKTKVICTIGPSSSSPDVIKELVKEGMSVARLNLSHCSHEFASKVIRDLRTFLTESRASTQVAILLDLNGTKFRTGKLINAEDVRLAAGDEFTFVLTTDLNFMGDSTRVACDVPQGVVKVNDQIFVDDGLLAFTVTNISIIDGIEYVKTLVENPGILGSLKGINLPTYEPINSHSSLTTRDIEDIYYGIEENVDFITLSCIRSEQDIMETRKLLANTKIKILSKIENKAGLNNFDKILKVSDGIIIDRGYLGVEIDITKIALVQKELIKKCQITAKPVLVANQVLESMKFLPRPSRSEVSDVTNIIVNGADGVILSGETAIGLYPLESLQWARKISFEAEQHINFDEVQKKLEYWTPNPIAIAESIACSAVKCAHEISAACIIVYTETGGTGRLLAKYRPAIPVVVTTNSEVIARQLCVSFGLVSYLHPDYAENEEHQCLARTLDFAIDLGICSKGDVVVITSGHVGDFVHGTTTVMRVLTV